MGDGVALLAISPPEYDQRVAAVRARLDERGADAVVLVNPARIAYLTGFHHVHTERPIALVVTASGELAMLAPLLEREHVQQVARGVERLEIYSEYPGDGVHPMVSLADLIRASGPQTQRLVCDNDGYHDVNGYQGPRLSEVLGRPVPVDRDLVDELRIVKSPAERELLTTSAAWADRAFRLLRERVAVGAIAADLALATSVDATRLMRAALGPGYQAKTIVLGAPIRVQLHGGRSTSLPHALHPPGVLLAGDILDVGAHADVGGYVALFGRTMFLGEPDAAHVKYFEQLAPLRDAALGELRPGRPVAEIERAVQRVHQQLGLAGYHRHHVGHGVGIELHERPYLDLGSRDVLTEGMVVTIEPGIYVPDLAGYRHADTVLITATGYHRLTPAPWDLGAMTLT